MDDTGHLRTSSLDELQAEDRQSRETADITIEFLEAMAGFKLYPWQRDVFERIMAAPARVMMMPRCPGRMSNFFEQGTHPETNPKSDS